MGRFMEVAKNGSGAKTDHQSIQLVPGVARCAALALQVQRCKIIKGSGQALAIQAAGCAAHAQR